MRKVMKKYVEGHWRAFFLQSLVAIAFGIFAIVVPEITLSMLTLIAAVGLITMGVIELMRSVYNVNKKKDWILSLIIALIETGVGVFLAFNQEARLELVAAVVAAFILVRGVFDIIIGIGSLSDAADKFIWSVSGIAGVVLGILIFNYPRPSTMAFMWLFGTYMLIFGVANMVYAVHSRAVIKKIVSGKEVKNVKSKTKAKKPKKN